MGLLPDIDENATVSQVRHFLRDDDKLPRLERLSGAWCELKSPTMDVTGVHGSGAGNATENRYVMHAYYYTAYQAVMQAIDYLSHDSQLIIRKKYLESMPNWQVAQVIGVASTQFGKRDRKACFEFADCLEGLAESRGLEEFDLDLHVYKNRQKTGELPAKERQKTGN